MRRLKVSENKRFLVYEDNTPFFYLGDTAWEIFHRCDQEEAELYLKDRATKQFTVIQAVALAELDGIRAPNSYGEKPLLDENDPTKINEAYFQHVDWMVQKANELGMFVGFLPTWGDKWNKKWGAGPEIFNPENARIYGEILGKRYKNSDLIWILGGDRPIENETHTEIMTAMAEGLRKGDNGDHLITYHPMGVGASSEHFHNKTWLDFNMIQSGHSRQNSENYHLIENDYSLKPTKPCMDSEPPYENHCIDWKPEIGWFDDYAVRRHLYWSLFAGSHGHTYGCHDIWQMWLPERQNVGHCRTPWKESLHFPGSGQVRFARQLLESLPYLTRIPDQSIIISETYADSVYDHIRATRDSEGSYALVYSASGKPFTLNLEKLKGETLNASWFDPENGETHSTETISNSSSKEFISPIFGEGNDWVLILKGV